LAASRPPDELVTMLNRFFGYVVLAVTEEGGWVNKFAGDGALCVFGAPVPRPDHAAAALRAGRRLRQLLAEAARSDPALDAGIGVAGGTVVAGNIGATDRYEYTVIGDPVNEAARLCELATGGQVLADPVVEAFLPLWAQAGERRQVPVRGVATPVEVCEPVLHCPAESRSTDPVCGIPLVESTAVAWRSAGRTGRWLFCSDSCLDTWESRSAGGDGEEEVFVRDRLA